jgi:D-alanyl-D-alanine endopeptidase (penicillin-binding protein 7)
MVKSLIATVALVVLGVSFAATAQTAPTKPRAASQAAAKPAAKKATSSKAAQKRNVRRASAPTRPSEGQLAGLHKVDDPLDLRSSVALVVDQDTDEVLFQKNPNAVLPIASITKLMTALVTVDAGLPLNEVLVVDKSDRTIDRVRSWLTPGVRLTRGEALHLALMSSENHAAQMLGRTYPGGLAAFVAAMNAKAQMLGMHDSRFADPTGLNADNRSSPADLVRLVKAAYEYDVIRDYSVSTGAAVQIGRRLVQYGSTNGLTHSTDWDIGLQKTGFISAAGRCLVMSAVVEGQRVVMVLLDSVGKYSRTGDAQRIKDWLVLRSAQKPAASTVKVKAGEAEF